MTTEEITDAMWRRDENALTAVMEQYGTLCSRIAGNILPSADAEEVVADTWMQIWNSIPPTRPASMMAYACRITRNLAINRYRRNKAACRTPEALVDWAALTENPDLFETAPAADPTAESIEAAELARAVDHFLRTQTKEDRVLFVRRYVYLEDGDALAGRCGKSRRYVHVRLHRIRKRLKKYLEEAHLL